MIQDIDTLDDVKTFFRELIEENLAFHPDSDFRFYIDEAGKPLYTIEEAEFRNNLLNLAFEVCEFEGAEIYALCHDLFLEEFNKTYPSEIE